MKNSSLCFLTKTELETVELLAVFQYKKDSKWQKPTDSNFPKNPRNSLFPFPGPCNPLSPSPYGALSFFASALEAGREELSSLRVRQPWWKLNYPRPPCSFRSRCTNSVFRPNFCQNLPRNIIFTPLFDVRACSRPKEMRIRDQKPWALSLLLAPAIRVKKGSIMYGGTQKVVKTSRIHLHNLTTRSHKQSDFFHQRQRSVAVREWVGSENERQANIFLLNFEKAFKRKN